MEIDIKWTKFALGQIRETYNYYSDIAGSETAESIIEGIINAPHKLSEQPELGPKEPILEDRPENFRYLIHKNYKLIYWHNISKNRIEIVDVFDTRQNPIKLKRNE